jgi:hypothetical protein
MGKGKKSVALGKKYLNPVSWLNVVRSLFSVFKLPVNHPSLKINDFMCAGSLPDYDDLVRDSHDDVTMEDVERGGRAGDSGQGQVLWNENV